MKKRQTNVSLSLLHCSISHLRWKAHLMHYNNNSWTMLRYACYEALHVQHLSLFMLGLHPFLLCFFTNERHFYVENVLKMRATSKATGKKNPQHFFSLLFWKGGIILWSSVFFRFIPAFLLCLLRCWRRVWRYSFCYKCRLLSYDMLTAMVLTFAHFSNEWH